MDMKVPMDVSMSLCCEKHCAGPASWSCQTKKLFYTGNQTVFTSDVTESLDMILAGAGEERGEVLVSCDTFVVMADSSQSGEVTHSTVSSQ